MSALASARRFATVFAITLCVSSLAHTHGLGPRGAQPLEWHAEHISRVTGFSSFSMPGQARTEVVDGKHCMIARVLDIDVADDFAYDIDETVTVEIEFDLASSGSEIVFQYDKNGDTSALQTFTLPPHTHSQQTRKRWYRHSLVLERARFAGRPTLGGTLSSFTAGDFSIATNWTGGNEDRVSICDIQIKRSYTTPQPKGYGRLALQVKDKTGKAIGARIGIYEASGRMPLPADDALPVKYFSNITRTVVVPPGRMSWPSENRYAFYINGHYRATLPVGHYKLLVARGLEYRILQTGFEIKSDRETPLHVELPRWTNMPDKGWYSGDVHIHYSRTSEQESERIRHLTRAEDLHVANLLQMGNIGTIAFDQYRWGESGRYGAPPYTLVPGQEDPRTTRRGHTVQLNLAKPIRNPERYYLYHEVFEAVRKQGGLTGYAHGVIAAYPGMRVGLALDVPYKLVDFLEVLQYGTAGTDTWFDFLNLGYKLSPAAGTDYPYLDLPGAVRNYVNVGSSYSVQRWFEGLKAGRTFVTNGPMLELTVNGRSMGAEVHVGRDAVLTIRASASLNPDIDLLDGIELIRQGETIASKSSETGAEKLHLVHRVIAREGAWFVLKARGKRKKTFESIAALSAPIYVYVDGKGFCKLPAIPAIAAGLKRELSISSLTTGEPINEYEAWETWQQHRRFWPANRVALGKRINEVNAMYDELIARSQEGSCRLDR